MDEKILAPVTPNSELVPHEMDVEIVAVVKETVPMEQKEAIPSEIHTDGDDPEDASSDIPLGPIDEQKDIGPLVDSLVDQHSNDSIQTEITTETKELPKPEVTPETTPVKVKKPSKYTQIYKSTKTAITAWNLWELVIGLQYIKHNVEHEKFRETSDPLLLTLKELEYYSYLCRIQENINTKKSKDFIKSTSIPKSWIRGYMMAATNHRNGFALICDHGLKALCFYINGTQGTKDLLHDLNADMIPFQNGYAHRGMAESAMYFDKKYKQVIQSTLEEHKSYGLVLVGHSLGAGVAMLLSMLWKKDIENLTCVAFAPPAIISEELVQGTADYITSFINGDDFVPRFSLTSFGKLKEKVPVDWKERFLKDVDSSKNKWVKLLKKFGLIKYFFGTSAPNVEMSEEMLQSMETDSEESKEVSESDGDLSQKDVETEAKEDIIELYPAGRIYHLKLYDKVYVRAAPNVEYGELILSGKWLGDHFMTRYREIIFELMAFRKHEEEMKRLPPIPKIKDKPISEDKMETKLPPIPVILKEKVEETIAVKIEVKLPPVPKILLEKKE
jgi:hypothetical protein